MIYLTDMEKIGFGMKIEEILDRDREYEFRTVKDDLMQLFLDNNSCLDVDISKELTIFVDNIESNLQLLSDNLTDENSISLSIEIGSDIIDMKRTLRDY